MTIFKWTVEFEISESWIADGFNLSDEKAKSMLATCLPYAYGHEIYAKVVKAPSEKSIRMVQGYSD
jgi:hypothetical protein